jgi:hypothetical protein
MMFFMFKHYTCDVLLVFCDVLLCFVSFLCSSIIHVMFYNVFFSDIHMVYMSCFVMFLERSHHINETFHDYL